MKNINILLTISQIAIVLILIYTVIDFILNDFYNREAQFFFGFILFSIPVGLVLFEMMKDKDNPVLR